MFILKDDNVGSSLMFLGTIFHNLGPVYLIECLPYVAVLNLGMTNSLLRKAYFVSDLRNRSVIYLGHILFLTLYMRVAMSSNLLHFSIQYFWRLVKLISYFLCYQYLFHNIYLSICLFLGNKWLVVIVVID